MSNEDITFDDIEQIILDEKKKSSKLSNKSKSVKVNRQVTVTKHQKQFLDFAQPDKKDQSVELLFSGSVGSGKSTCLVLELLKYCQTPNSVCLLLHLHLSSLKKSTLPLLLQGQISKTGEYLPPLLPPECIKSFNKSDGEIFLTNNSKIIISGVQNAEKLKSINANMAVVDEVTNLKQEDYFSILQRCRVFHPLPNGVFSACNPTSRNSWVYKYFFQNPIQGYREAITVNSYSNSANLPASYIKSLEGLPEIERRRMLFGEWVQSGQQVFYAFDKEKHVRCISDWQSTTYEEYMLANDLGGGGQNAYSGTVLLGKKNGIYYILEEFTKTKTTHEEVLAWLEQYRNLTELVAYDPANAVFMTSLENNSWKPLKPDKNIETGVAKLNSMFSSGKLIISSKCANTIKQFEDNVRDEDSGRWNKSNQVCDLLDAIRYGLVVFDNNSLLEKHNESKVYVFSL